MRPVAFVTMVFPTLASFIEDDVQRLVARGVRARVYAPRGVGCQYQPRQAPLAALAESVGSPLDLRAWGAVSVARQRALERFDAALGFERCFALLEGCGADAPTAGPGAGR